MLLIFAAMAAALSQQPANQLSGGNQAWISASSALECVNDHYRCAVRALHRNDIPAAVAELHRAANQRDPQALRELGLMHLRGDIVRRDDAAAVGWFYEAALAGDRQSMQLLGYAFANGIGVAPDKSLADYWQRKAAAAR